MSVTVMSRRRRRDWRLRRPELRRVGLRVVDPSSGSRLRGIQGVRALSAAAILLGHIVIFSAPPGTEFDFGLLGRYVVPHLPLGVTLLFVLSAFLLYRPFAKAVLRGTPLPSVRSYLWNRAMRILPAYWFILLFASFVLQTTLVRDSDGSLTTGALNDPLLLLANATFLHSFAPDSVLTGISPAWALTDIVVFYLALPVLVLLAWELANRASTRRGKRWAALAPAFALFALGMSGKVVAAVVVPGGAWDASWHAVIERSFWAHADLFAFGLAVAVLRVESEDDALRLPRSWWKAAVPVMLIIALATAKFTEEEWYASGSASNLAYDSLMAVVCAIFLALVVLPAQDRPTLLVKLLEAPFLVTLGIVSYSLFLWQFPIIDWLNGRGLTFAGVHGFAANVALIGALTFLFSAITYRYLEFPPLARKARARGAARGAPNDSPVAPTRCSGRSVRPSGKATSSASSTTPKPGAPPA